MKKLQIARAFRDEDYYLSLSDAERQGLPAHPSEVATVDPRDLRAIAGGATASCADTCTIICTPCRGAQCA